VSATSLPPLQVSQDSASKPSAEEISKAIGILSKAGFRAVQDAGWHFQKRHFYCPLNDCEFLEQNRDLWSPFEPLDIDWRVERQLDVAHEVSGYVDELRDVPQEASHPAEYAWNNAMWNKADALVQYGLIRSRKPARIVEIGCGWSSLLMAKALSRNEAEGGHGTQVSQVDPYPRPELMSVLPSHWEQHRFILQRAPSSLFERLGPGDILFYDGSHCAKAASDVNWFFFRVLPRLRRGVLIHIHDIVLPQEYPEAWILERGQTWNEQYVLQAFLMHNQAYEIEIANAYLASKHHERLKQLYKNIQPHWGASVWMRKVGGE